MVRCNKSFLSPSKGMYEIFKDKSQALLSTFTTGLLYLSSATISRVGPTSQQPSRPSS